MTERKSFKRRVRARMEKTGERYTAARRHAVERTAGETAGAPPEPDTGVTREDADRMSDEAVARRTGKTWSEWFALLDAWGASERSHREIARHLNEEHGVRGWWAQTVTVGYERARGLRAKHERPEGYAVSTTKTVAVGVDRLFAAFTEPAERERWLPGAPLALRTAQPARSARFDWGDGRTRVNVYFTDKGPGKSSASVEHERLADAEEAERTKAEWRERLASLEKTLQP